MEGDRIFMLLLRHVCLLVHVVGDACASSCSLMI